MKLRELGLLFILAALWGASFLFIRISAPVLRPFPLVTLRVLLGGSILLIYAIFARQPVRWRTHWQQFLILGALNNAIPYALIATAQLHLTASLTSMLNATTPLFSAIVAAVWLKDRFTFKKGIGLLCGLAGVAVIVGWRPILLDGVGLLSVCASLAAACSYGAASVYGKIAFKGLNPLAIAIGQLFLASALVLPLAALNPPMQTPTPNVLLAVIGLAVLSTALAYLLYFDLIANAGPTAAASVTFLVPFFSILWGNLFLGETIEPEQIIGFGIILIGLVLVLGLRLRTPAPALTQAG